jgi:hypothetical protein
VLGLVGVLMLTQGARFQTSPPGLVAPSVWPQQPIALVAWLYLVGFGLLNAFNA